MESATEEGKEMQEPKTARRIRYAKQTLIVMTAGLVSVPSGMIQLWPNVLASHIAMSNTTIFGNEISLEPWQLDLVASVTQIGALCGFLLAGYLVIRVGRRWSLVITAIPGIFGSALITLAVTNYMIIIGRFLDGITNGMMNVAVFTYASEVSDPKIRGGMCMLSHLLMQSGGILTISLGTIFSWYYMSLICGGFLVLHCLLVPLLKESPSFLAVKNHDKEALKILQKLRGSYADIKGELAHLQEQNQSSSGKTEGYGGLLKKEHIKTIGMLSGVFFIHNFCGTQVLRVNATRQLQDLGLALDEKVTTILVIGVLFIGNFFMTLILDKFGRRRCIFASLVVVAISYAALGTFIHLHDNGLIASDVVEISELVSASNGTMIGDVIEAEVGLTLRDWFPLACLMGAAFGHAIGIGPLVWVLPPENFPTNLRSQGTGICTMIGSLQTFAVLQLFSIMQAAFTQAGLYWTFASVATLGIFYIYFFLKETTGSRVG